MSLRSHSLAARVLAMAMVCAAPGAWSGTLQIAPTTVEEARVIVPVRIQGDVGEGVAALDFLLNFDPAVLQPIAVSAGTAATAAGKLVQGSPTNPGQYVVVMMGMNQRTVRSGEVARVVMRRLSQPENNRSEVSVSRTTLASLEAQQIPSKGSSATVTFSDDGEDNSQDDNSEDDSSEEPDPDTDASDDESPDGEGEPGAGDAGTQADDVNPTDTELTVVPVSDATGEGSEPGEAAETESPVTGSAVGVGPVSLSTSLSQGDGDKSDTRAARERLARLRAEAARQRAKIPDRRSAIGPGTAEATSARTLAARAAERGVSPPPAIREVPPLPGEEHRTDTSSSPKEDAPGMIVRVDPRSGPELPTGPVTGREADTASIPSSQGGSMLLLLAIGVLTATVAVLFVARRRIVK